MSEYSVRCRCGTKVYTTDTPGTVCKCGMTVRDWLVKNKDLLENRTKHHHGPTVRRI